MRWGVGWLEELRTVTPHTDTSPDLLKEKEVEDGDEDMMAAPGCCVYISHWRRRVLGCSLSSLLASVPLLSFPLPLPRLLLSLLPSPFNI